MRNTLRNVFFVSWAVILGFCCSLSGCQKRKLLDSTPGMDLPGRFWIRVLLFENIKECSLVLQSGFRVNDGQLSAAEVSSNSDRPFRVSVNNGSILVGEQSFGSEVLIQPNDPFVFSIDKIPYRGNIRLIANRQTGTFSAINELPVVAYLAGVVGAEMPSYWQSEALKAQAIAARTYCLYIKENFGGDRSWDVKRTQSHQVYLGISAETATVWSAVDETAGKVLTYGQDESSQSILPAYYSSSCGGHTDDSRNVYGGKAWQPLAGVACPYCRGVAKSSFFFWDKAVFDADEVSAKLIKRYPSLKSLGSITAIEPIKQVNGRITSVKLLGEKDKSATLRGEDLRLAIDPTGTKIRSMVCKILKTDGVYKFHGGKGFGHGVGLCQCGAQGMARKRKNYNQILAHYYPGSTISRIY